MMGVLKFQMLILPSFIYRTDLTSVKIPASYCGNRMKTQTLGSEPFVELNALHLKCPLF